jgi:phosphotransferase system enzyme I (PtsI)
MLLIGLGLRSFSATPAAVPEVKRVCRSITIEQCEQVARRVKNLDNARDIRIYLKEELSKVFPELP